MFIVFIISGKTLIAQVSVVFSPINYNRDGFPPKVFIYTNRFNWWKMQFLR